MEPQPQPQRRSKSRLKSRLKSRWHREPAPGAGRRWVVLGAGLAAMMAACSFQYGLAYLVPALRRSGMSLAEAGTVVTAPAVGILASLMVWGVVVDRHGERLVMAGGLAAAGLLLIAAARADAVLPLTLLLAAAGAAAAGVHVASGRLILGWFADHERGRVMGVRQAAQPLGVALAALILPPLAGRGIGEALTALAGGCLIAAVLQVLGVRDPAPQPSAATQEPSAATQEPSAATQEPSAATQEPSAATQEPAAGSPYRGRFLPRVHLASALLVVPQFAVGAFAFDYLVSERHWPAARAGSLLAGAQLGGAVVRLAAGWWSDRAGSRLRPMRALALTTAVVLAVLAAGAADGAGVTVAVVGLAMVLTSSTNGLAYTAVAERAGRAWAGRALGVQNTAQNLAAVVTPPTVGALVSAAGAGYAVAFGAVIAFPLLSALVVPIAEEWPFARSALPRGLPEPVSPLAR